MKLTPFILGACGIALTVGGVAGAAIDTSPMQRGNDVIDEIAMAASTHPGDRIASLERAAADRYAMETPEGRVEVDELAWYGRDRNLLGSEKPDFEADDREEVLLRQSGHDTPEYAAFERAWDEPTAEQIVPMRSPVDPDGFAAFERQPDAVAPLALSRPAQLVMSDASASAERAVGSSRRIDVQAELAAR